MEYRQLRTFTVVADNLSFCKAAVKLHMAQSSVSAQIRLLEEELSLKLFDRIGRRVIITEAGIKLYGYAPRMLEMTNEIRSEITASENVTGSLTIRIPDTLATVYMPRIVERFYKDNPLVKLNFINCADDKLREELNSGRIDFAFLMAESINLKEVKVEMLRTLDLVMIAGPVHSFLKKKTIKPDDLTQQTILLSKTD